MPYGNIKLHILPLFLQLPIHSDLQVPAQGQQQQQQQRQQIVCVCAVVSAAAATKELAQPGRMRACKHLSNTLQDE
jgi:hypothetical protein